MTEQSAHAGQEPETVDALKARIAELENALQLKDVSLQNILKLSGAMNWLVNMLLTVPALAPETISKASGLLSDPKMLVYRTNRRLAAHGVSIKSRRDVGYFFDEADRQKLATLKVTN